tara:strand:- start:347 stop:778 length:432 start_codon:yes stop_codon:yes gene_type:complete
MKIAIIDGSTVKQVGQYRALFPNTSFTRLGPSDSFLSENNCKKVADVTYNQATQKINAVTPFIDGDVVKEYEVVNLTTDEKTAVDNTHWGKIRTERNEKLKDTDWRASSDLTLTDAWKTYRQNLRDIPNQSDPWNITWPTEPS